ncbi:MAG: hypothetical protein AAFX09_03430 [Pseudomonadota bacterium]
MRHAPTQSRSIAVTHEASVDARLPLAATLIIAIVLVLTASISGAAIAPA